MKILQIRFVRFSTNHLPGQKHGTLPLMRPLYIVLLASLIGCTQIDFEPVKTNEIEVIDPPIDEPTHPPIDEPKELPLDPCANWKPELTFRWDKVTTKADGTDIPNTRTVFYMLHWGKEPRNYTDGLDSITEPTVKLEGLTIDETYYFAVTAYFDIDNQSGFSEEVSAKIACNPETGKTFKPMRD